jgi:hypothetical protein
MSRLAADAGLHLLDNRSAHAMTHLRTGSARSHVAQRLRPRLGGTTVPTTQPLLIACAVLYCGTSTACLLCVPLRQPCWRRGAHSDTYERAGTRRVHLAGPEASKWRRLTLQDD